MLRGTKPIIEVDKVYDVLTSELSSQVLSIKQIKAIPCEELGINAENSRLSAATVSDVARKISRIYKSLVAVTTHAMTLTKVSHKSGIRHTSKNSLMSIIC